MGAVHLGGGERTEVRGTGVIGVGVETSDDLLPSRAFERERVGDTRSGGLTLVRLSQRELGLRWDLSCQVEQRVERARVEAAYPAVDDVERHGHRAEEPPVA